MSLKDDLLQWKDGVDAFDKADLTNAFHSFLAITDVGAKIFYNLGAIYSSLDRHDDAIISFTNAVYQDEYLVVAYFQRGISYWLQENYRSALESWTLAEKNMRGNSYIDYRQLGLYYMSYRFEITFNMALCHTMLGEHDKAMELIHRAQEYKLLPEHSEKRYTVVLVRTVLEKGGIADFNEAYPPFAVPDDLLFKPPQIKVDNVAEKDYMGQSRLIASCDNMDTFVGFAGPKIREVMNTNGVYGSIRRSKSSKSFSKTSEASPRSDSKLGDFKPFDPDAAFTSPPPTPKQKLSTLLELGTKISIDTRQSTLDKTALMDTPTYSPIMWTPLKSALTSSSSIRSSNQSQPMSPWSQGLSNSKQPLMKAKCHHDGDIRVIVVPIVDCTFKTLYEKVSSKFQLSLNNNTRLKIRYRDEDNELMLIGDDEDVTMALEESTDNAGNSKLELHLS